MFVSFEFRLKVLATPYSKTTLKNNPSLRGRTPCQSDLGKHLTSRHASRPEAKIGQLLSSRPFERLNQQLNHAGLPFELELDGLRLLALINDKCTIDFLIAQTLIQQDNHEGFPL
ncbi:hypothetical protein N7449_008403 [Penicillium cf. viridicatum]|uniref:Uncharacterized protein n=1 Tax=Penicillium cf. viridicatum TaxID=2972119 RepID=A0A9W9JAE5_9EURO|nr:hypothetical protein N7449_008403 [Penicillium cf. viridicatum]